MKKYEKLPLTISEQISHLKDYYNIEINNYDFIKRVFTHVNYYKLRGYWFLFEKKENKVTFEDIFRLYEFDKKLRILFLEYIEIVESSIKSVFTNYLTVKYKMIPMFILMANYLKMKIFTAKE